MDRFGIISQLLGDEERLNAEYVLAQIDRQQWAEGVKQVDERLAVLGVRLVHRPWEGTTATKF